MSQGSAPRFFTICASNYLAHAAVLGRSVAAHHAGARLTVFLLDALPVEAAGLDHLEIVAAETLMPPAEWHHYQCFYDLLELATSIKPACVLHLLDRGHDGAIYLDADIVLFRPLEAVLAALAAGHDLVLTPHLLTPLPADGRQPDDLAIMRSGIYNLGFAGFASTPRCRDLLRWWQGHLRLRGMSDVNAGLFTDQKWLDFAPALLPGTHILRDPGCNVAYWNLHERIVRRADDGWRVTFAESTSALTFFHFSGYSPAAGVLSKHENRFQAAPPGDTRLLLEDYAAALAAAGSATFAPRRIESPRLENGIAWDPVFRALYRDALAADPEFGDPLHGNAMFALATGSDFADPLPRYLRALLRLRPDVATACRDGEDVQHLIGWLRQDGAAQLQIDPALPPQLRLEAASLSGVNYVGYFRSHLGVAEAARNAVTALQAAGLEVAGHDISQLAESPQGRYALARGAQRVRHGVTILGVNADETPRVLDRLPQQLAATFRIGYWAWETPEFPESWCDRFALVDEVWVASQFIADAVRQKSTVPVTVVPYAVAPPAASADRPWLIARRPEIDAREFIFLTMLDVASVPFRKNPEGAIAAFGRAFGPDEPVRLIVKTLNGARDPALMAGLVALAADRRVTIWDEPLETRERFRLLATADAFVSLHRAEGFGLSIAEAMAFGKPVVVTGWSGNADFTGAENAAVVSCQLARTDRQHGAYPPGTLWAEPDLVDAARQLRRVADDAAYRARIGAAAARTIETQLSPATIGAAMKARLERLSGARRARPVATGAATRVRPGAALGFVLGDAWRRPLFYLVRLPRVPGLLAREGFSAALTRFALSARARPRAPRGLSLRVLVVRLRELLGRIGLSRSETRVR